MTDFNISNKYTETQRILADLFREPVEVLLARDYAYIVDCDQHGLNAMVNTFKVLDEVLTYDADLSNDLDNFINEPGTYRNGWSAGDWIKARGYHEILSDNTCNGESSLDTALNYTLITTDPDARNTGDIYDADHVILWVHCGGDVRGNYTYPVVFELADDPGAFLIGGNISLSTEDSYIDSENGGYSWYINGDYSNKITEYKALDDLFQLDHDHATKEQELYKKLMQDTGRDTTFQIETSNKRIVEDFDQAIKSTRDYPTVIFYWNNQAFFRGSELQG